MDKITPEQWAIIISALLAVSEALSLIPQAKSNGIFQLIYNTLMRLKK